MTTDSRSAALSSLVAAARVRKATEKDGKTRIAVQVGHCSVSVGADDVAAAVREMLTGEAYMVTTGCNGACFDAPQVVVTNPSGDSMQVPRVSAELVRSYDVIMTDAAGDSATARFLAGQRRLALDGCGDLDAEDIDDYLLAGGYAGLARALSLSPEEVIDEVRRSGLRGRGGAYFPAAAKWESARGAGNSPVYLVVNAEEGEPGVFKDRHLMEGLPYRVLEGATIAAYAAGAHQVIIYINAEADLSARRMRHAIEVALDKRLLGEDILGSGFDLSVEVRRGAGGYVCGEETTLLNTVEGYRREPRLRPPFPTELGLWAKPTVINNVETLAGVPFIMAQGAEAFAGIGTETDKGTKIISLSGAVSRPGLVEVPMGTTLREVIFDIGGGLPDGRSILAAAVGGPSSGLLPPELLDTAIRPGPVHSSGVMLGAGGVIALDDGMSVLDAVRNLAAYNADESCGKCTPCREGTPRMVELLDRLIGGEAVASDLEDLRGLAETVNAASLCGLGQAAGNPVLSALTLFPDEFSSALSGDGAG